MSLFGSPKTQASQQTVASGVTIQSSIYGSVVPVLYGRTRLTGNLCWYGAFQAIPPKSGGSGGGKGLGGGSSGKGGGGSSSYDYKASFLFALAEGPLAGVQNVWSSRSETAFSASNLSFAPGSLTQAPWGYLTTYFPGQNLSYAGTGYVYAAAYDLGSTAQLPNLSYEVTGLFSGAISGLPDADPKDAVVDVLTNPRYGIGFPAPRLGDLTVFSSYCRAAGLVISPLFNTQQAAASQLNQIVQDCNAEFVWSGATLTIVPYGDQNLSANGASYTAPSTPLFSLTDDDFLIDGTNDPVQCSRARPSDQMNSVKLEWLNRANQYNIEIVEAKDQAAIELYGLRADQPKQSHHFCDKNAATMSATLQLQRQAVRNQYSFTLGWRYCLLDPMDIVEITDSALGLAQQWVRIVSMEEDDNGNIKITAEDFLGGTGTAPLYSFQHGSPFIANYNIDPGSVNTPLIFEPTPAMLAANSITAPQIIVGASGGANWGGCDVWLSLDNAAYQRIGRISTPVRQGILTNPLASATDPDTVHTLSVDLTESRAALLSGTQADADAFRTLCYVDGELIAYETADLTGGHQYGLTYLRRGVYGTTVAGHASGTEFFRLDDNVLWVDLPVQPVSYVGQTLYLKFLSYNLYGGAQQQLASVSAYTYNPNGSGIYVAPPSSAAFTVGAEQQKDGSWISFGVVSWTASPDPFFDQYELQYRLHTGPGPWISFRCGANTTSFRISPLPANTAYDVQVRAVRTSGPFYSAWAQDLNVSTIGKTTPPPAPGAPSAVGGYRQITLDWPASAENDIALYEVWESADSTQTHATRIGLINGTHYVRPGLNLSDQRWYWIRAMDTSGNFSAFAGPATATTLGVDSSDLIGQIVGSQIATNTVAASNLISGLNVVQAVSSISLADHTVSLVAYDTTAGQLYNWNGSSWVMPAATFAAGSVTLASFATGLTPVQIVSSLPGSGTEGEVVVLTADGQLYRYHSGAWTAQVPAAGILGQLTSAQIASITAAQLTGQITTTQITNGAITTPLLGAGAVQTANLAAGAVTAATIAANTITGGNIAGGTITGSNIAGGTITASNIAANTITAGQLAAGSVTATQIAAGAVIASKLFVGDTTNLIADPQFQDSSYWGGFVAGMYYDTSGIQNTLGVKTAVTWNIAALPLNTYPQIYNNRLITITPNASYNVSCQVAASSSPSQPIGLVPVYYDARGTYISQGGTVLSPPASGVQTLSYTFTPPANAVFVQIVIDVSTGSSAGSGYWSVGNVQLVRQQTGVTIANGTITAANIAAGTITANQIAAGTITAAQIEAGGITGDRIAGNTITASNLAANAVTATAILAGTITGDKLTGNFFQGYTFNASSGTGSGYAEIFGGVTTLSGQEYGPFFRITDDAGHYRVIMGRYADAYGLWIWDAAGNPIFEEAALGTSVVSTINIAPNNVTYPYGVSFTGNSPGSSWTTFWSHNADVSGTVQVNVAAIIQEDGIGAGGNGSTRIQILVNGSVIGDTGAIASATVSDSGTQPPPYAVVLAASASVTAGQTILVQGAGTGGIVQSGSIEALIVQR